MSMKLRNGFMFILPIGKKNSIQIQFVILVFPSVIYIYKFLKIH